jgi:hypothetical protein
MARPSPARWRHSRLALIGAWGAGTAIAVAVSIAAINMAGSGVADSSSVTLSHAKVAAALDTSHPSAAVTTTERAAGKRAHAASSNQTKSATPGIGSSATASPGIAGAASPTTVATGPEVGSTETIDGSSPKTTVAPTTTTTTPSSTATKSTTGGTVQVQCIGNGITLLSAVPSAGYELDSRSTTTSTAHVEFSKGELSSEIDATCANGVITFHVDS